MNPRLKTLLDEKQALIDEGRALRAKADHDDTEAERYSALPSLLQEKQAAIERERALDQQLEASDKFLNGAGITRLGAKPEPPAAESFEQVKARTGARFFGMVSESRAAAQKKAHRFGMFVQGALLKRPSAIKYCESHGIPLMSGHLEGVNEDGGALVPVEFEGDLIDLREQFGMFRRYARVTPMSSDVKNRPRRKSGLTAYFVGEGDSITESAKQWDQVKLVAKKLAVLTRYTSELGEDAIISMGDDLAGEMAYAFANKEDECGFYGDGTSTYGGIVGVGTRLIAVHGVSGGPGLVLGSGNLWSELTLNDFQRVVGALPEFAETPNVRWFCHKVFFETVMVRLMTSAGGLLASEIASGMRRQFMGYDVVISQVMPKTDANSTIPVILGDLRLAADFGDRRATTIAMSEHTYFDTDEIGVRCTERFDINVHDVGDASAAGPIVGLLTQAA